MDKWIPVSERMPEVDDEYIITIRERWGEDEEWDYETTTAYYDSGKWSPSYDVDEGQEWEVIAWMPLPKPYREEKTDKEQLKSAMEGFTSFMRAICNNDNLGVPKEMADEFGISEEYRRNEE